MYAEKALFQHQKIIFSSLPDFGFAQTADGYIYTTPLLNGQFNMQVDIDLTGQVWTKLTDNATNSEYVLHMVDDAQGEFVGAVRAAYQSELEKIAAKCFQPDVFQSPTAQAVIAYVEQTYQDKLEFLWPKMPENAIFRRQDNQKWYAALLTVKREKIGLPTSEKGDKKIEIIDLRLQPNILTETVDNVKYFPGYHMNKKHWYTICLDDSVAAAEICQRLAVSYELAKKK